VNQDLARSNQSDVGGFTIESQMFSGDIPTPQFGRLYQEQKQRLRERRFGSRESEIVTFQSEEISERKEINKVDNFFTEEEEKVDSERISLMREEYFCVLIHFRRKVKNGSNGS